MTVCSKCGQYHEGTKSGCPHCGSVYWRADEPGSVKEHFGKADSYRLWSRIKRQTIVGVAVFIISFIALGFAIESRCRDGWHSSSIGQPGACSHHGGVDQTPGFLRLFASAALAAAAIYLARRRRTSL